MERAKVIFASPPGLLNYQEACEYLSLERRTLERLVHDGKVPVLRIEGYRTVRFPLEGLQMWIAENSRYEPAQQIGETLLVRRRRREAAQEPEKRAGRPRNVVNMLTDEAEAYYSK